MESSQLHCFGNGSLNFLPADFMVGIVAVAVAVAVVVFKDLRDSSSSSSHEQRTEQSSTYEPKKENI